VRDLIILLVHLVSALARLVDPGGMRSVVAETLVAKQQMLILTYRRNERFRSASLNLHEASANPHLSQWFELGSAPSPRPAM
jgi:hypothetical protein